MHIRPNNILNINPISHITNNFIKVMHKILIKTDFKSNSIKSSNQPLYIECNQIKLLQKIKTNHNYYNK